MTDSDQPKADSENGLDLPAEMFRTGDVAEETSIQMQRRIIGPIFTPAKFSEVDGHALFEGDIMLGPLDEVRALSDPANPESKGVGIVGEEFRWPDPIPYTAQAAVRQLAEDAMAHWEANTPFCFIEHSEDDNEDGDEVDCISFEDRGGCWSYVGRQGGKQVISIGSGCRLGSAIHEIGHALGLWHEQSRSDRDDFIEVLWENIHPDHMHNFDKHVQDGQDLGAYDFGSIMHYPEKAFSKNGQVTIRTKQGTSIGQRNGLGQGDIAAIKLMYPDLDWDTDK
jgi:hypothetical protein